MATQIRALLELVPHRALPFNTGGHTLRMIITGGGDVGIGTS
ncbi:MAG: hypothetical protein WBB36_09675 [Chitinophagales bacterium]